MDPVIHLQMFLLFQFLYVCHWPSKSRIWFGTYHLGDFYIIFFKKACNFWMRYYLSLWPLHSHKWAIRLSPSTWKFCRKFSQIQSRGRSRKRKVRADLSSQYWTLSFYLWLIRLSHIWQLSALTFYFYYQEDPSWGHCWEIQIFPPGWIRLFPPIWEDWLHEIFRTSVFDELLQKNCTFKKVFDCHSFSIVGIKIVPIHFGLEHCLLGFIGLFECDH